MFLTFLYESSGLYAHTQASPLTIKAMELAGYTNQNDSFTDMLAEFITMCMQHYKPFHHKENSHD